MGKHKLFPRISPNKSWEGSIGGGVFVIIVSIVIAYFVQKYDLQCPLKSTLQGTGLGLVVIIFGTWGDLIESPFKRTLGIKDSGTILPGHGGLLDRFDSALLAFPAAVVYVYTISMV
ncbi:MAG: phosphatidate cytidylyltransferase, partial [Prevotella sp.]|nr:phosphatidate cytidylyltransferase [Candidatus Equicola stercoris]